MLKFNPTTPIQFYAKTVDYVSGQGATESWELIKSGSYEVFFCEWRGSFGNQALSAQAMGIKDSATVRVFYVPAIYEKLRTVSVMVIKNADPNAVKNGVPDKNNPNVYELWGGVDNVREANRYMEFRVRRYEGK